tara:strand:+ start:326 stop:586 length:261 start_codon:yes stop_codon:yes gene_type:complete
MANTSSTFDCSFAIHSFVSPPSSSSIHSHGLDKVSYDNNSINNSTNPQQIHHHKVLQSLDFEEGRNNPRPPAEELASTAENTKFKH